MLVSNIQVFLIRIISIQATVVNRDVIWVALGIETAQPVDIIHVVAAGLAVQVGTADVVLALVLEVGLEGGLPLKIIRPKVPHRFRGIATFLPDRCQVVAPMTSSLVVPTLGLQVHPGEITSGLIVVLLNIEHVGVVLKYRSFLISCLNTYTFGLVFMLTVAIRILGGEVARAFGFEVELVGVEVGFDLVFVVEVRISPTR